MPLEMKVLLVRLAELERLVKAVWTAEQVETSECTTVSFESLA